MLTLGINAAFHDCSACIVRDGIVLAAAEEERFTRIKHGKRPVPFTTWQLPFHAIDYCLGEAGVTLADVDHVAYAYDPWLQLADDQASITLPLQPSQHGADSPWAALAQCYVVNAPRQLCGGAPHHLRERFDTAVSGPAGAPAYRWHFVEHHRAHEASAFLAAPFDDCAVLVIDGRGELAATSYGLYRDGQYRRLRQLNLPHSLGLLYEAVTTHLGFLHSSDEYKVMALASYGKPRYARALAAHVHSQGDGDCRIDPIDCHALFGEPRTRGAPLLQHHFDIAQSLQQVLEDTVLQMARWLHDVTQSANLALAGGVALNCVMNARLRDAGPWQQLWVQPAAGDAGTALGAALWIDAQQRSDSQRRWRMAHAYLGPAFGDDEIEALLQQARLPYRRAHDLAAATAALLAQNKVIGWFQQRMEFGPRALGARSILASPLDAGMQARLNLIKDREDFRPVAPVVPDDDAADWFDGAQDAPFMTFVFRVRDDRVTRIPAVRHVDGTARVQTVTSEQNPALYALLKAFKARTGVPVLINTSFNTRGEPVVCTPRDALASFCTTPLDALAIGPFIVDKATWSASSPEHSMPATSAAEHTA